MQGIFLLSKFCRGRAGGGKNFFPGLSNAVRYHRQESPAKALFSFERGLILFPASTASFSITSELPSRLTFDSCLTRVRRVDSVCRVGTGFPLQTPLERLRHESEIPGTGGPHPLS